MTSCVVATARPPDHIELQHQPANQAQETGSNHDRGSVEDGTEQLVHNRQHEISNGRGQFVLADGGSELATYRSAPTCVGSPPMSRPSPPPITVVTTERETSKTRPTRTPPPIESRIATRSINPRTRRVCRRFPRAWASSCSDRSIRSGTSETNFRSRIVASPAAKSPVAALN